MRRLTSLIIATAAQAEALGLDGVVGGLLVFAAGRCPAGRPGGRAADAENRDLYAVSALQQSADKQYYLVTVDIRPPPARDTFEDTFRATFE